MVPCAKLKVFTPLEAFPPHERERWAAYVAAGRGLTRRQVDDAERGVTVRLLTGRSPLGPDAALVRRAGPKVLICPLQLDLRAAVAFAAFRRTVPPEVVDAFVPGASRSSVEEPGGDAGDGPGAKAQDAGGIDELPPIGRAPHILDAPWAVPLEWFVAFEPGERRFTDPPEGAGPRITYLTTCAQAARRLERAIKAVEATIEDGEDVLAALAGTAAWIDAFDPSSLLELDYGEVAGLFAKEELRADETCAELWEAIAALEEGDLLAAVARYGVARGRWSHRRAKHHAS